MSQVYVTDTVCRKKESLAAQKQDARRQSPWRKEVISDTERLAHTMALAIRGNITSLQVQTTVLR
jgi:hypothetical protein